MLVLLLALFLGPNTLFILLESFLTRPTSSRGVVAQSLERPSKSPGSRCNSTDNTWVEPRLQHKVVGKNPSHTIWHTKMELSAQFGENVAIKHPKQRLALLLYLKNLILPKIKDLRQIIISGKDGFYALSQISFDKEEMN